MAASKRKMPSNVVSLADFRRSPIAAVASSCSGGPDALENARLVAWLVRTLGVDLRLVAAIQRGDVPTKPV